MMTNYLLLYSGGGMPASEAKQKAFMKEWEVWYGKLGSALVDGGNPFGPKAKTVASNGKVSEGPLGAPASGYSMIKADSLEAAVALAKVCPVLKSGASISVYETIAVEGM
jgi:hypothetical protein